MRSLTTKQRGVIAALHNDEWRSLDEIVRRQGPNGLSRGRTENLLLEHVTTFVSFRRQLPDNVRMFRLSEAGEFLVSEIQR